VQGVRKPRGSSEDIDELEGASDGEVGADLDDCEDHEEDLELTAATGGLPYYPDHCINAKALPAQPGWLHGHK